MQSPCQLRGPPAVTQTAAPELVVAELKQQAPESLQKLCLHATPGSQVQAAPNGSYCLHLAVQHEMFKMQPPCCTRRRPAGSGFSSLALLLGLDTHSWHHVEARCLRCARDGLQVGHTAPALSNNSNAATRTPGCSAPIFLAGRILSCNIMWPSAFPKGALIWLFKGWLLS